MRYAVNHGLHRIADVLLAVFPSGFCDNDTTAEYLDDVVTFMEGKNIADLILFVKKTCLVAS
jgi:hypothetical protein